jgi:hypothetical protein
MQTEFEVSVRLIFWGDQLDPAYLAKALNLEISSCTARHKGDVLKRDGNGDVVGSAKTGMLSCPLDKQLPQARHDPDAQFQFATTTLQKIQGTLGERYSVEKAELQIFVYYDVEKYKGEADFNVPSELLSELHKHQMRMSVTVLP